MNTFTPQLESYALALEQEVLGRLLCAPEHIGEAATLITARSFSSRGHRVLWRLMTEMDSRMQSVNCLDIAEAADRNGDLETIGGLGYLVELVRETATSKNALVYCHRLRRFALAMQIKEVAGVMAEAADIDETRGALKALLEQFDVLPAAH